MTGELYILILEKRVIKFIKTLPPKHQTQIKKYILGLGQITLPHDSQMLKNYEPYRRDDSGEYRIVYRVDESIKTIYVILVGKRNGGEVYKTLRGVLG
jgi:mRNA interferase RelE/StbE